MPTLTPLAHLTAARALLAPGPLSVHGRVDAETPLHEFVSDVIFAAEGAQS